MDDAGMEREDDDRRSRHENADRMHGDDGWMRDWMRMPEQIGLERRRYPGMEDRGGSDGLGG